MKLIRITIDMSHLVYPLQPAPAPPFEAVLGLTSHRWLPPLIPTRRTAHLNITAFGVQTVHLKGFPSEVCLLFPTGCDSAGRKVLPLQECEDLAYYVNTHILGRLTKEGRVFHREVGSTLVASWHPGQKMVFKTQDGDDSDSESNSPKIPFVYLEEVESTEDDIEYLTPASPEDMFWEIDPLHLDQKRYEVGRKLWKGIFDKYFAPVWRSYGEELLTELGLWPFQHPSRIKGPEMVQSNLMFNFSLTKGRRRLEESNILMHQSNFSMRN